ncbi:MAG: glycosyltransferase [Gemmatimonas sp.]
MRVALVSDWMSSIGGAEAYFHTLRLGLRAAGHDAALFACGPTPDPAAEYSVVDRDNRLSQSFTQIVNPFAARGLRAMVRDFRPDVVLTGHFAYHISPLALDVLGDVPFVVYLMDYKTICPIGSKLLPDLSVCREDRGVICLQKGCVSLPHWLRDRPRYALMGRALQRASALLTPGLSMHRQLAAAGIHTTVLRQPVPMPSAEYQRRPAPVPRFLFVGRLSREKGVPQLIATFANVKRLHPNAELRIAGDGPLRSEIERAVAAASSGVALLGALTPAQIEAELASAWALVAPSLWEEPFGLVALEAIVRGVPVVASNAGGFSENVVHGVTGLLVEMSDAEALTASLTQIASGAAFPGGHLKDSLVREARESSCPDTHVRHLMEILKRARTATRRELH